MTFSLPNFLNEGGFNALRMEMGAPLTNNFKADTSYKLIELPIVERLRESGVDVEFDEIKVLDDRTLSYKGYRVLLYIRDVANYGDRQSMPRYHMSFCRTLDSMQSKNRFQRYVVANREDGLFQINIIEETTTPKVMRLSVCQNCLGTIGWNGFRSDLNQRERLERVKTFDLKEFFEAYPRDLISVRPEHTSDTAPLNDYTADWPDVSERIKMTQDYRCGKCYVQLSMRLAVRAD